MQTSINKEYVIHKWINPNTIEKRRYQDDIASRAVLRNTLVVIPTGLGKTSIAAVVCANRLQKDMTKKIMFLAPTKPLVDQHRNTFEKIMKIGSSELKTVTGTDPPSTRALLYNKADVVFSTPQTVANDLKNGMLNFKEFSLLIVDEAHRSVGNYAYVFVADQYMKMAKDPLILALTASPGSNKQKIDEIKKKLFIEHVEIKDRDDEDVRPYVQKQSQAFIHVELIQELRNISSELSRYRNSIIEMLMSWKIIHFSKISKVDLLKLQAQLARSKSGSSLAAMSYIAEILKIDHALILAETQTVYALRNYLTSLQEEKSKAAQRLIKSSAFEKAIEITHRLDEYNIEHPKVMKLKDIIRNEMYRERKVIIFAQYRDTINKLVKELREVEKAKPVGFFGQAKKAGKGLSQKEQIEILNEFKLGFYNILVCTSIGEEGLDIAETDTVIFYEPIPSEIRKIQRAGRTARTKAGKVLVMMTKGTRDEAFYWSGYHKENKMKSILQRMKSEQSDNNG
ncbi:MAG: DEAD/DEAH box helicase [Candidatus Aenigmarchaeota archaeon]|nr:DEAD/DEAH box helicase [Candidatus Aenigmarchaeota archaeon]